MFIVPFPAEVFYLVFLYGFTNLVEEAVNDIGIWAWVC